LANSKICEREFWPSGCEGPAATLIYSDLELVERGLDAVRRVLGSLADDGHAGDVGALRLAHG
jgi:hypothetical protein